MSHLRLKLEFASRGSLHHVTLWRTMLPLALRMTSDLVNLWH